MRAGRAPASPGPSVRGAASRARPAGVPSRPRTPRARSRSAASPFGGHDCRRAIKDVPDAETVPRWRPRSLRSVLFGARQRSRGPSFGRIRGNDRIAYPDLSSDEDLGAKSASVDQPGEHAPSRQSLQMGARLAQSDATEPDAPHEEFLADEMVQGHSPPDDIPTRIAL